LGSGVVKYDAPGTTDDKMLYLLKDHLGSVVKVLSINGNTVTSLESFSYDVWGNRRNPITWENTNITTPTYIYKGFTGHEHIEGFGLIHMKGRVYDPALGLFLSPDPYVQSMTAQGFNRYSYCMGNPLMYTDPDGEWVHLVLGAVVGGLFNWIANGAEFSMRGLGYFGVGALSGMLGAGIGSGVNALFIEGGTFANGFVGKGIVESAVGFIAGGASSAAGGTVGSFITGFGNGLLGKEKFKDALLTGTINAGIGGGLGFITGGIAGGIAAKSQGKHFGDGSIRTKDVLVEQQIKSTVQDGDFDCTFANIVATSNGMENQAALRTQYAPFTDKNKDGVNTYFVTKKYAKDMGLSFEFVNLHKDPMSAVEIAEKMNAGANLILSIGEESGIGHTWTVKSITNETIIKQNGKVISKNIYTMLDTRTGNFYSFPNHNARAAFFIGIK
ncbi:MAG: RHS repeat-associated core domain-containing protein, partial [Bacteroidales bacterium]|nr:RHS repeat-associated core domain-containing protein [Bacteroidales bacterium]